MPVFQLNVNGNRCTLSMWTETCRCSGPCATSWGSRAPSSAAALRNAAPAPSTSTAGPVRSCVTDVGVAGLAEITTIEGCR